MHFIIYDEPLEDWHCIRCVPWSSCEVTAIPVEESSPPIGYQSELGCRRKNLDPNGDFDRHFWAPVVQPVAWSLY
jgi:hypothetical protein